MNIQRLRFPPIATFFPFGGFGTLCTYYDTLLKDWSTSSWVTFQTWKRVRTLFPHWQLAFWTTPKWPDRSVKLRSLNNSWGWHKTIFSTESCSHPTKINESQQKKCHGVKTYAHSIQTIKQQKKREHSLHFHYCDQIGWALATAGFLDNTEVLPQSVILFHFSPQCG